MRFFFHYNKPLSKKWGHPVITLHYGGTCTYVRNIECRVPTKGRISKRQPFFVMTGDAEVIVIDNEVATIA